MFSVLVQDIIASIKSSIVSNSLCHYKTMIFHLFMTEDTISVYKISRFYLPIFNNTEDTVCLQKLSIRIITLLCNMAWLSSLDYKAHWANCSSRVGCLLYFYEFESHLYLQHAGFHSKQKQTDFQRICGFIGVRANKKTKNKSLVF